MRGIAILLTICNLQYHIKRKTIYQKKNIKDRHQTLKDYNNHFNNSVNTSLTNETNIVYTKNPYHN